MLVLVGHAVGLVLGATAAWLARRDTIRALEEQVTWLRTQEAIATDRLVHAWKEGATVPPRPAEEIPPPDPLPSVLQEELDQWEDQQHRVELELQMRAGLHAGKDPVRILMELDNSHP